MNDTKREFRLALATLLWCVFLFGLGVGILVGTITAAMT